MLKCGGWFQTVCFDQDETIYIVKKLTRNLKITNDNLRRRHSLLVCRHVIWIITPTCSTTGGDERVPDKITGRKWNTKLWRDGDFFFSFRISSQQASKHPQNSLSSSCYLLAHCVLKHRVAIFRHPETLGQLHRGPLLSFIKGALLPNFKKVVEVEFLIMEGQQLEDIFKLSNVGIGALGLMYLICEQRTNWPSGHVE